MAEMLTALNKCLLGLIVVVDENTYISCWKDWLADKLTPAELLRRMAGNLLLPSIGLRTETRPSEMHPYQS